MQAKMNRGDVFNHVVYRSVYTLEFPPESFKYSLRKVLSSSGIPPDQQKRVWHSLDIMQRTEQTWWLLIAQRQYYLPPELVAMIQARIAYRNGEAKMGSLYDICSYDSVRSQGKRLLNSRHKTQSIWHAINVLSRTEQAWWLLIAERQQILPRELVVEIQQWISCKNRDRTLDNLPYTTAVYYNQMWGFRGIE